MLKYFSVKFCGSKNLSNWSVHCWLHFFVTCLTQNLKKPLNPLFFSFPFLLNSETLILLCTSLRASNQSPCLLSTGFSHPSPNLLKNCQCLPICCWGKYLIISTNTQWSDIAFIFSLPSQYIVSKEVLWTESCSPPKFICWSPNSLAMWPYLEIGQLKGK